MGARSHWQIQKAVFLALFFREVKTRFGRYRLGYFWALIEPLSHILVLTALFSAIRDRAMFYDVPFPIFFATGILAFFSFQKIVLTSQNSIKVNMGLFGFRQVKPFDAIMVRAAIEFMIIVATILCLTWLGGWVFGFNTIPADPLRAIIVLLMLFLFGLGAGFMAAVVGALYEEWAKFIPQIMRPLYFISGIFFPIQAIPKEYHVYLLWNPLLHGIEQFRAAWIAGYPAGDTSLVYLQLWMFSFAFVGLWYYRENRIKVLMS